jgi:CubicO group peptidase (beta-lactamase class C family)
MEAGTGKRTSVNQGDGGIYTSIDDLAKWGAALYGNRLLSDASRKLAFSAHAKVVVSPIKLTTVSGGASLAIRFGIPAKASVFVM